MLTTPGYASEPLLNTPPPLASQLGFGANKRSSARFGVKIGSVGSINIGVHGDGTEEIWPLAVQDLSRGGMKVILARRFEPGTEISVELSSQSGGPPRRVSVRVVRVRRDRSGHWTHGCSFAEPLTEANLKRPHQAILNGSPRQANPSRMVSP